MSHGGGNHYDAEFRRHGLSSWTRTGHPQRHTAGAAEAHLVIGRATRGTDTVVTDPGSAYGAAPATILGVGHCVGIARRRSTTGAIRLADVLEDLACECVTDVIQQLRCGII